MNVKITLQMNKLASYMLQVNLDIQIVFVL